MAERNYLPEIMDRHYRARKPPGGDTNDIFDLEQRQRESRIAVYEDNRMKKMASDKEIQKKYHETEDIISPRRNATRKLRRSSSEGKVKTNEPVVRSPPLATGKENMGTHFKNMSPRRIGSSKGKGLDESEDEKDEGQASPKKQAARNPITGEGCNPDADSRSKLEDTTNVDKDKSDEMIQKKAPRRPCIRVRQPPGGRSSIIF